MKLADGRTASRLLAAGLATWVIAAYAHSPVFDCYLENDDTVTCEGGFSDGTSAENAAVRVLDENGKVLLEGKIDAEGRFSFRKPDGEYHIVFDAGPRHSVTIFSSDIE